MQLPGKRVKAITKVDSAVCRECLRANFTRQKTLVYLRDFKQKDRDKRVETGDTRLGYLRYGIWLGLRPKTTFAVTTTLM